MKNFAALLLDRGWASYVHKWKTDIMASAVARNKGFVNEAEVEQAIAVFCDAVMQEYKLGKVRRFAFDLLDPTRVTFDGRTWHDLPPPQPTPPRSKMN